MVLNISLVLFIYCVKIKLSSSQMMSALQQTCNIMNSTSVFSLGCDIHTHPYNTHITIMSIFIRLYAEVVVCTNNNHVIIEDSRNCKLCKQQLYYAGYRIRIVFISSFQYMGQPSCCRHLFLSSHLTFLTQSCFNQLWSILKFAIRSKCLNIINRIDLHFQCAV